MKVDLLCFVFEGIFRFGLFSASKCTKGTLSLYLYVCMCDSLSTCVYVCVCVGCIDTGRLISEPDLMHKMPPEICGATCFFSSICICGFPSFYVCSVFVK